MLTPKEGLHQMHHDHARLRKVRILLTHTIKGFLPTYGRMPNIPNKPTKWGVKGFTMVDNSSGYISFRTKPAMKTYCGHLNGHISVALITGLKKGPNCWTNP